MSNKKIGVVLSGCGVNDGSEIHEAICTILSLDKRNIDIIFMAPDIDVLQVFDHYNKRTIADKRNVLIESARIARGNIKNIKDVNINKLDGVIFPGGFGAAKNLCDFALNGVNSKAIPEIESLIKKMHELKKPMGFICIAPVLPVIVLKEFQPKVTIGNDAKTASIIEKIGGIHIECTVNNIVFDEKNNIITTPAYMLGPSISYIEKGIDKLVDKMCSM